MVRLLLHCCGASAELRSGGESVRVAGCAVVPRAVARHMCLDGAAKSGERYA